MNIIFNPPENEENKYVNIMVGALKKAGFNVYPLDSFLSSIKHFRSIKLVHLNWFENVDDSTFFIALRSFFRKLVVLTAIKLGKKKLVWTMHNRSSHEKGLSFFSRTLMQLLIRTSHTIILHSKVSGHFLEQYVRGASSKAVYIPHPDFIDVYGPILSIKNKHPNLPLNLLFVGTVKPYKNIELLIQLAKKFPLNISIVIAGNPSTVQYKTKLESMAAQSANIDLQLRFVPDEELPVFFQRADLLILPYDLKSSLNSGTVILAFSYGKTVICPNIGTISDLGDQKKYVLTYSYENPQQHQQLLFDTVEHAIHLKQQQPTTLQEYGHKLFEYVKTIHQKESVGKQLIKVYSNLLN